MMREGVGRRREMCCVEIKVIGKVMMRREGVKALYDRVYMIGTQYVKEVELS